MKKVFLISFICLILSNFSMVFASDISLEVGNYQTPDEEHVIVINEDNTAKYDNTYSLTINDKISGDTLTGKLGTDNKSVTFHQLNSSNIILGMTMNYKHSGDTVYLYDYTVFSMEATPVVNVDGGIEVWHNEELVNTYADLQSAVDAAQSGDRIEITKDLNVVGGAYVKGKYLIIDGNGKTINSSCWLNSIFVVEEDATLDLENLTIDGKATGFEVNYDINIRTNKSTTISIKTDTDSKDIKRNFAIIISKGNLNIDKAVFSNNYTAGNGTINIVSGTLNVNDTTLNHNRATKGGAIYIGSNFKKNQTEYSVKSVIINNSELSSNYSNGNGGAIMIINAERIEIDNVKFLNNVCSGGSGGAISTLPEKVSGYYSIGEKLELDYPQVLISDSTFDGNWVGNDGAAIANEDGELNILNTTFKNNVGVHCSSSVGTVSMMMERKTDVNNHLVKDCLFESNLGTGSVFGDHATPNMNIDFINTTFTKNIANYNSMLIYSANVNMIDCKFIEEVGAKTIVEIRPSAEACPNGKMTLRNVNFINCDAGSSDIYMKEYDSSSLPYQIIIEGETTADIDLWSGNNLLIKGDYTGIIETDNKTTKDNIVIEEGATMNGEIYCNSEKNVVTLIYPHQEQSFNFTKYLYIEGNECTPQKFYSEHLLIKDAHMLEIYTDAACTTKWNFNISDGLTVYSKWVEHVHILDEELVQVDNMLVKACECGYFEKYIKIIEPDNLIYDENKKEVSIENTLEITEYSLEYKVKGTSGDEVRNEAPRSVGTYKAVLTVSGDKYAELEYEITKAAPEIAISNLSQKNVSIRPVTYTVIPAITDGEVKIEYKNKNSGDEYYSEELPKSVGTYLVRLTLTGDTNIEDAEKIATLKITKRTSTGSSTPRYEIKVEELEGGIITPSTCKVKKGSNQTFEIEAEEGYEIEDVLVDGESVGTISTYTFENVKEKHTIEAIFKKIEEDDDTEEKWENPFVDVSEDDWFYEAVKFANKNKLFNGISNTEFGANVTMTRGMIVTVLYRLEGEPATNKSIPFADVDMSMYYANAVIWAKQNNIVNGIDEMNFAPNAQITREQLVAILYRYAQFKSKDVSVGENTNILSYEDFSEISEYAISALQWGCGSGLIKGRNESTLSPKGTATRAEVATMIMRFAK